MPRVVMERDEPLHLSSLSELHSMDDGTMPPADMVCILGLAVLSVVYKEVHTERQLMPGEPSWIGRNAI